VFTALFAASLAFAGLVARPWFVERLPHATSALGRFGAGLAGYGFALLFAVAGWFVALVLAPPLSAPALESLVGAIEARAGMPPRAPLGFFGELACGVRAFAGATLLTAPCFVVLWAIGVAAPPAGVVTAPLAALVSALLVAWSLFDYPLTLRGVGFRARLELVRANFSCVLGFGAAFALSFWLPCAGVLLLPVGAIAATRLLAGIFAARDALAATPPTR
jgi:hypothetical protein